MDFSGTYIYVGTVTTWKLFKISFDVVHWFLNKGQKGGDDTEYPKASMSLTLQGGHVCPNFIFIAILL